MKTPMIDSRAIISAYQAAEKVARDLIPGRFLLPEDVALCIDAAAEQCGVTAETAADVMADFWTMRGS